MPVLPDDKSTVCNPAGSSRRPARSTDPRAPRPRAAVRARHAKSTPLAARTARPRGGSLLIQKERVQYVQLLPGQRHPAPSALLASPLAAIRAPALRWGDRASSTYVHGDGGDGRPARGVWCGRRWRLLNRGAHVVRRWGPCVPNRTCHGPLNLSLIVSSMFLLMSTYCTTKDAIYLAVSG